MAFVLEVTTLATVWHLKPASQRCDGGGVRAHGVKLRLIPFQFPLLVLLALALSLLALAELALLEGIEVGG
ncbi:hypothetical protein N9L19_00340 [bacterium]|nr:hypothetical protein [bacterium]